MFGRLGFCCCDQHTRYLVKYLLLQRAVCAWREIERPVNAWCCTAQGTCKDFAGLSTAASLVIYEPIRKNRILMRAETRWKLVFGLGAAS